MEEAVEKYTDLYLRCPVSHFGTLDWDSWNEITRTAEPYVKKAIQEWKASLLEAGDPRTKSWHRVRRGIKGGPRGGGSDLQRRRPQHKRSNSQ